MHDWVEVTVRMAAIGMASLSVVPYTKSVLEAWASLDGPLLWFLYCVTFALACVAVVIAWFAAKSFRTGRPSLRLRDALILVWFTKAAVAAYPYLLGLDRPFLLLHMGALLLVGGVLFEGISRDH